MKTSATLRTTPDRTFTHTRQDVETLGDDMLVKVSQMRRASSELLSALLSNPTLDTDWTSAVSYVLRERDPKIAALNLQGV